MDRGEGPITFDLDNFLPYRLAVAASHVSREFAALYQEEFGISPAEWRILAHLSQTERVSVRDIYERVDMDKSKVSRAAASLERAGLVEKKTNPGDRRLVSMSLTEAGHDLVGRIIPSALAFQERLLQRLGNTAPMLSGGLDRLTGPHKARLQAARRANEPPAVVVNPAPRFSTSDRS